MVLFVALTGALFCLNPVQAAQWETLFEVQKGDGFINIEVDKNSVKTTKKLGDKVMYFDLHVNIGDDVRNIDSYNSYRVNCDTRDVWRTSTKSKIYNKKRSVEETVIKSDSEEKLEGKEYRDFLQIMHTMCTSNY
jgi:hypothetical protein